MKRIKLLIPMIALSIGANAQGWVAPSSSILHPVNSTLGLSPVSIGIGLNAPTEQLHTNKGVRFEGLTNNNQTDRIVTQDLTGKLYWRDLSTIVGSGSFWNLLGNSGTVPGTGIGQNYLGTTDGKRVVFATNATERMTILNGSGNVGIGGSNPLDRLHVQNGNILLDDVVGGASGNIFMGSNTITNSHLRLYYESGTSPIFTGGIISVNTPSLDNGLIFRVDNVDGSSNRMKINGRGHVGINTNTPTSMFHVNCTNAFSPSDIRFENLPEGSGRVLVIDDNGYVYKSRFAEAISVPDPTITKKIETLENEIEELKSLLQKQGLSSTSTSSSTNGGYLGQNAPNPFSVTTTIKYELPKKSQNAAIGIYDMNGKEIKLIQLSPESIGSITIQGGDLLPGMYLYSLIIDGKYFDSKKMILTSQ